MKRILLILITFFVLSCSESIERSSVIFVSVSSDGRYILSSHHGKKLWLWDVKNKSHKEISNDANIYSPYFIKGSDKFIWQEIENRLVHLSDINGKDIKIFNPGFDSYGEVMSSDLKTYIASDIDWNIFKISNKKKIKIKAFDGGPGYDWVGKLLDLSLVDNILLSSGDGSGKINRTLKNGPNLHTSGDVTNPRYNRSLWAGVMLWDIDKEKPIYRLDGNMNKTHATLSPDGHYVVAGDENGLGNVWETKQGSLKVHLASLKYGLLYFDKTVNDTVWDKKNPVLPPKEFCQMISDRECLYKDQINAIKFISNNQYFRFTEGVPYVVLYDVLDPRPKKYLSLGTNPEPATFGYDIPVDTAPEAGILVMGQVNNMSLPKDKNSGINVYQYDKKNQSLKLIWAPDGPKAFKRKLRSYE